MGQCVSIIAAFLEIDAADIKDMPLYDGGREAAEVMEAQ